MSVDITMPKLAMTMEEGKVVEWTKKEGETVRKGDVILVIETDKATHEVEAPASGILAIVIPQGEGIAVGTLLGRLVESQEEYQGARRAGSGAGAAPPSVRGTEHRQPGAPGAAQPQDRPVRATPAARALANRHGVELSAVAGSGPQGRITPDDVLAAVAAMKAAAPSGAPVPAAPASEGGKRLLKEEPLTGMRGAIARNMMHSLAASAQITAFTEWDVTELLELRERINAPESRRGFKATIPGMMVFLLARVLKEMPVFNASVEGDTIRYWADVNVGVAVALPDGLVVPVVRGADRLSLGEIHAALAGLVDRARRKKLSPDDMKGGTFTLTNLGSYGGEWETVIINPPEAAILGIGRSAEKPVVREGRVDVRKMMPASLTYDHRIIDGEMAGRFRRRLKELVEEPVLLSA